ncbi:AraC family transcriptional regulator [Flavipsychrobacter stenotrophus]|uniref:AraC family transcriptional regulator n=1 Tax=Flavipsychrobacter stenotrophus TaxID=2077091 RepID=A0A2S7SXP2_9BACT|nr:helix-turn-helix domain-containing protein [Flavipsychrobacter stenotrophus]PQJ11391.1 AraC family transcriptional regulator [Flavipsychrobacter stenotrophus]
MKHISIIVPKGEYIMSSVLGTYKIFVSANQYLLRTGRQPMFKVALVGLENSSTLHGGAFSVHPDTMLANVQKSDLIIIPAIQADNTALNMEFIPWIKDAYAGGAEVASLCTGSFLLASTGLLDGKHCSTHWAAADAFRQMFPDVTLMADKIITDEQGTYSSGGAYSFLNLVLYIIEKYCGRDVAIFLAKLMEIEIDRDCQSQFAIFNGQKDHEDEPIKQAQTYMESNVGEKITIEQVAGLFSISRRNFERRFKKATANTPVEYLQRVRVEAAKKSLETGRTNVNEVMYAVGYTDGKAFRTTFKKITGLSPLEYRKKYSINTPMMV